MMKMNPMDWIVMILIIVGGLNWGLVGFFDYNLVSSIFGDGSTLSKVVYDLVGLAALWSLARAFMMKPASKSAAMPTTGQPPM